MTVGEVIIKYRKENNLTQKQLAELLCVSSDLVSKWECGNRRPDYETVQRISGIVGVDSDLIIDVETAIADELKPLIPETVDKEKLICCFNSFLGELNEKQRTVFELRYNLFLDTKTIADKVGSSDEAIRKILSRIRGKLKKYIRRVSL